MWKKIEPETTPTWNGKEDGVWKLEEGDEIEGVYKEKQEGIGENNSNIYKIETEDGDVGIWGSTVLDTRFSGVEKGEKVKVIYKGEVKSPKTKRVYRDYDLYHYIQE